MRRAPSSYQQRNAALRALGFPSYAAYLASPLWKSIHRRVVHGRCKRCRGRRAEQVHHITYDIAVLRGLDLRPLVRLCAICHRAIEFDSAGHKVSLEEANRRLLASIPAVTAPRRRAPAPAPQRTPVTPTPAPQDLVTQTVHLIRRAGELFLVKVP